MTSGARVQPARCVFNLDCIDANDPHNSGPHPMNKIDKSAEERFVGDRSSMVVSMPDWRVDLRVQPWIFVFKLTIFVFNLWFQPA